MKRRDDSSDWMWSNALAALDHVERMHRQLFAPRGTAVPSWEPPVDVLETASELLVYVALPGVDVHDVRSSIEGDALVVRGHRVLPRQLRTAIIHRMELPQGHFERRIPLPEGHYASASVTSERGCLVLRLEKVA